MSTQDLLSDALTRIRNAQMAGHEYVIVPCSKLIQSSLEVLKSEGYIEGFERFEERKGVNFIKIDLKYYKGEAVIQLLKRVSKPARRVYAGVKEFKLVYGGLGTMVLTTPGGVMSSRRASELKLGGEVLFEVF